MSEFRQLLEAGDVDALRSAWHRLMPHLPQLKTREEAEIAMHMARTGASTVTLRARAYSHRWLVERGHQSQLPDELKPKAERMYPVIVEGVGIFIETRNDFLKPALLEVRGAMEDAVNDAYAEGRTEPSFVKARMEEARTKTMQLLFGGNRGVVR